MAKYTKRKPCLPNSPDFDKRFPVPRGNSFIFVYGDEMLGFNENEILKKSGARFITFGFTKEATYNLHDFGKTYYPAASEDGHGRICGEVYQIDAKTLESLDIHNNTGKFFERKLVKIHGFKKKCWMWSYIPDAEFGLADTYYQSKGGSRMFDWRLGRSTKSTFTLAMESTQPSSQPRWRELCEIRVWGKAINQTLFETPSPKTPKVVEKVETKVYTSNKVASLFKPSKFYNPNIVLENGTVINKDTLAHDLLTLTDWLEKAVTTKTEATEEEKTADILSTIKDMREEINKLASTNEINYSPREVAV
jgi:gamma-glutamylcyclotransferase (GGCT)/AIG2-like uncharacterized protein YtfP